MKDPSWSITWSLVVRPGRLGPVSEQEEQVGLGAPLFVPGTAGAGAPRLQGPCSSPPTGSPWGALLPVTLRGEGAARGQSCWRTVLQGAIPTRGSEQKPSAHCMVLRSAGCCTVLHYLLHAAWCCTLHGTLHAPVQCCTPCCTLYGAADYGDPHPVWLCTPNGSARSMAACSTGLCTQTALHPMWLRPLYSPIPCAVSHPVWPCSPYGPAALHRRAGSFGITES